MTQLQKLVKPLNNSHKYIKLFLGKGERNKDPFSGKKMETFQRTNQKF